VGAVATFDPSAFAAEGRYPEFSTINPSVVSDVWNGEATLYLRNDGGSPVQDAGQQRTLLNMITAHILALNFGVNGEAPSPLVGRIASAGEGSVNVSVANDVPSGSAQWFAQTKYGAAFWGATSVYRRFQYFSPCARPADPWRGGW
jgi:hypothetical protein